MNQNTMKTIARDTTAEMLDSFFTAHNAIQFADASWAISQNIEGQQIWTEITIKSKAFMPTRAHDEFNPYDAAEKWLAEKKKKEEAV